MPSNFDPPKCQEVMALLSEYLDLELPPEACHEVETHIAGCAACVDFAESVRRTVALCRQYQPSEMPGPIGQEAKVELQAAYEKMLVARRKNSR